MSDKYNLAYFYEAKYYCENCDSISYLYTWGQADAMGGSLRCKCSDFEDEE